MPAAQGASASYAPPMSQGAYISYPQSPTFGDREILPPGQNRQTMQVPLLAQRQGSPGPLLQRRTQFGTMQKQRSQTYLITSPRGTNSGECGAKAYSGSSLTAVANDPHGPVASMNVTTSRKERSTDATACVSARTTAPQTSASCVDGVTNDKLFPGNEVAVGAFRFQYAEALGRGSSGEVWSGTPVSSQAGGCQEVALKEIYCRSNTELEQALFEADLLERLSGPEMLIPKLIAHQVDWPADNGGCNQVLAGEGVCARVRIVMTRAPGEPLDRFLSRPPQFKQSSWRAVRRGCALSSQLIRQLGPTLHATSKHVWHRDVNPRNVMLSDALDGGALVHSSDPEETGQRASFCLIDFGLATRSSSWESNWLTADVAGDCRYWAASSYFMSFYGPEGISSNKDFCNQYQKRLDIVGLGLTALELLCSNVLASRQSWCSDGLGDCWRSLCLAWEKYNQEVTGWHTQIYQAFKSGEDAVPMYIRLAEERVVERVAQHHAQLGELLRSCAQINEKASKHDLLTVLAEMIDERSRMELPDMVDAVGMFVALPGTTHTAQPISCAEGPARCHSGIMVPRPVLSSNAGRNSSSPDLHAQLHKSTVSAGSEPHISMRRARHATACVVNAPAPVTDENARAVDLQKQWQSSCAPKQVHEGQQEACPRLAGA